MDGITFRHPSRVSGRFDACAAGVVESWTLLGDDLVPVEPVERFLTYLALIERSPDTIKAYAHDLKDWLTHPGRSGAGLASGELAGGRWVHRLLAVAAGGPR